MINRKLFLLAIFLMSLVAVSAVSAAENATDDIEQVSDDVEDLEIIQNEIAGVSDDTEDLEMSQNETELTYYYDWTFPPLQKIIDDAEENSTVTLDKDYIHDPDKDRFNVDAIEVHKDLTIDGNGHKVDACGRCTVFLVDGCNVVFKNLVIVNGANGYGNSGGIDVSEIDGGSFTAIGCTFEGNSGHHGGAMNGGTAIDCTFNSNFANCGDAQGGAVYKGTAINCTFTGNYVIHSEEGCGQGGAMYESTAINCVFRNNSADYEGGAMGGGAAINCVFSGNHADKGGDSMCNGWADSCIFENNPPGGSIDIRQPVFEVYNFTSACGSGDKFLFNLTAISTNYTIVNRNIHVNLYYENHTLLSSFDCSSDGWKVELPVGTYIAECNATDYDAVPVRNATLNITQGESNIEITSHNPSVAYTHDPMFWIYIPKMATGNITVIVNGKESIIKLEENSGFEGDRTYVIYWNSANPVGEYNMTATYDGDENFRGSTANATSYIRPIEVDLTINASQVLDVGNTTKIDYTVTPNKFNGNLTFESSNPEVAKVDSNGTITAVGGGTAIITVSYYVNENYTNPKESITVTVNRFATQISADAVSTTYNINRNLVITLTDAKGNPLSGLVLTVKLNGAKDYTTDKNGQVKINVAKLSGKTYNANIAFAGNSIYSGYAKSVKVTVKKATPKLIAKKKTYRASAKTKKFTVTLKSNIGKPIRNAKVWISIKKITKKAKAIKTNSKGKATFKFNKNKKGKYLVTIKFKGDKYYRSITKKVKITIR
jgi:hypothetical protein